LSRCFVKILQGGEYVGDFSMVSMNMNFDRVGVIHACPGKQSVGLETNGLQKRRMVEQASCLFLLVRQECLTYLSFLMDM